MKSGPLMTASRAQPEGLAVRLKLTLYALSDGPGPHSLFRAPSRAGDGPKRPTPYKGPSGGRFSAQAGRWMGRTMGGPALGQRHRLPIYSRGGFWTDRVTYHPPLAWGVFLPHPDAPDYLKLSFRLRLKSRHRVKRKVDVTLQKI